MEFRKEYKKKKKKEKDLVIYIIGLQQKQADASTRTIAEDQKAFLTRI